MIKGVRSIDEFHERFPEVSPDALQDWFNELVWFRDTYSRDPSTKVGAAILDHSNSLWALAINDYPHYIDRPACDDLPENRSVKLDNTDHAELNSIREANFNGVPLDGKIMLTTLFPCNGCMREIKFAGITDVIAPNEEDAERLQRWVESFERAFRTATSSSPRLPSIRVYVADLKADTTQPLALPRMKRRLDDVMHMDRTGIAFSHVPIPYEYLKTWQKGDHVLLSPENFAGLNNIRPTENNDSEAGPANNNEDDDVSGLLPGKGLGT